MAYAAAVALVLSWDWSDSTQQRSVHPPLLSLFLFAAAAADGVSVAARGPATAALHFANLAQIEKTRKRGRGRRKYI